MVAARVMVTDGGAMNSRQAMPGDVLVSGDNILAGALATVGAGTWTAASMATGIIYRTGPTGAYTDTTDTAVNILAALAGNTNGPDVVPGSSFKLRVINSVAYAATVALGTGVVFGTGVQNISASTWRDYLVTILSTQQNAIIQGNTATSTIVTFTNPISMDPRSKSIPLIGASVSGSGVPAGTTVVGVTQGQGTVTGVTLSAATTTSLTNTALTFGPLVQLDSIGSGTL